MILNPFAADRLIGTVFRVDAMSVDLTLPSAGRRAISHHGEQLARGQVGEFVVIDLGGLGILGRISEVWLTASERELAEDTTDRNSGLHPVGRVQLLATVRLNGSHMRGVERHPRIGDPTYSANADVLKSLLADGQAMSPEPPSTHIRMGALSNNEQIGVSLDPARLFGRHLAVLGSTGSGKSWTLSHIVDEVHRAGGKLILIDATGEFHTLGEKASHISLGTPDKAPGPTHRHVVLPHHALSESDLNAFLRPSGASQLPRLREAIRSLRLAHVLGDGHDLVDETGCIKKEGRPKTPFLKARKVHVKAVEGQHSPWDFTNLPRQIQYECVYDDGDSWGRRSQNDIGYCTSLIARIYDVLETPAIMHVLTATEHRSPVFDRIDAFVDDDTEHVLRISLRSLPFSNALREIVVNAIGRHLLDAARRERFRSRPVLVCVDEAHQFFGKTVGDELSASRLEHFESIAKEGRKYGLTLCMATQRPGDLPAGVISQAGMLLVHRLGDGRDRERVEQASSELDRSGANLLASLTPGEALFIGVDFPIPLAVRVPRPAHPPQSEGPQYSAGWGRRRLGRSDVT